MTQIPTNLPALTNSLAGIPAALVPASLKALDRLIGAATDVPAAWLTQQKAKIDAQTQAYALVEAEISKAAASEAGADLEIVERAVSVLVRKAYRKQKNREAVAAATVEELIVDNEDSPSDSKPAESQEPLIDDDWLNVFERYAEDATSDRMQKLWGRVLSGEIRHPGKFSMRTLRFLSEFSQKDAISFAQFTENAFGGMAPKSLVKRGEDITALLHLEAAGLTSGAGGLGLQQHKTINSDGFAFVVEGPVAIVFGGKPGAKITTEIIGLTPLGVELLSLLPGRDPRAAARAVAFAMRCGVTQQAFLANVRNNEVAGAMEPLWLSQA